MKSALIAVYVLAVLLVSGFARAEYAFIKNATYDSRTKLLHVSGQFANSCQANPNIEVVRQTNQEDRLVALIGVKAEAPQGRMCAQVLSGHYDLVVDARSLPLSRQGEFELQFLNADSEVQPIIDRIDIGSGGLKMSNVERSGTLVALGRLGFEDAKVQYALVNELNELNEQELTFVQSVIDLSQYLNQPVRLQGLSLNNEIEPAVDIEFGKKTDLHKLGDLMFATEISSAPLQ